MPHCFSLYFLNPKLALTSLFSKLQQQGSYAATKMEIEQQKDDYKRTMQIAHTLKKTYENLHQFCIEEILDGDKLGKPSKGFT